MINLTFDGTTCDFCENPVYTALRLDYKVGDKVFCCKECADDYERADQ